MARLQQKDLKVHILVNAQGSKWTPMSCQSCRLRIALYALCRDVNVAHEGFWEIEAHAIIKVSFTILPYMLLHVIYQPLATFAKNLL